MKHFRSLFVFFSYFLIDHVFNLKFAAKELQRNAKRCEKQEKEEKTKLTNAIKVIFAYTFSFFLFSSAFASFRLWAALAYGLTLTVPFSLFDYVGFFFLFFPFTFLPSFLMSGENTSFFLLLNYQQRISSSTLELELVLFSHHQILFYFMSQASLVDLTNFFTFLIL